jgi:hypothetical protein
MITGIECAAGFGGDDQEDQMIGRVLRVSQSAPQVEVDLAESDGFTFLSMAGVSTEGMITGSAPQQLQGEIN